MENNGTIIRMDTDAAKQLQERLNSEKTLKALDHLLERIDTLEQAVDRLATTMEQGPGMVSMVTDMVDEAYQAADRRGVNLEERLSNGLQLLEQLTAPAMVEKINNLLQLADQLPGLIALVIDLVDEESAKATEQGLDLQALLSLAGKAGQAASEAQYMPPRKVSGLFGLMRELRDPNRQKAIGLVMDIASTFGKKLP